MPPRRDVGSRRWLRRRFNLHDCQIRPEWRPCTGLCTYRGLSAIVNYWVHGESKPEALTEVRLSWVLVISCAGCLGWTTGANHALKSGQEGCEALFLPPKDQRGMHSAIAKCSFGYLASSFALILTNNVDLIHCFARSINYVVTTKRLHCSGSQSALS